MLRLSTFPTDVASVLLTGLSTATNAVISAADSVLIALGKLQAQVSLRAPIASPTFTGTVTIPSGAAISGYLTTAAAASTYQTALGFTPYNATNPSGYQTAAQVAAVLPVASSTAPLMNGVAEVGSSPSWAHGDHVHPTDTTLVSTNMRPVTSASTPASALALLATQTPSGHFWKNSGGVVNRLSDRVFVGQSTLNDGNQSPTTMSWTGTEFVVGGVGAYAYLENNGMFNAAAPLGQLAGVFSTRASDGNGAGSQASIAVSSLAINDNASVGGAGTWNYYGTTVRTAASTGENTFGMELDVANLGTSVPLFPSSMFSAGLNVNLWLAAGGELPNQAGAGYTFSNTSAAIGILSNNGAGYANVAYDKGIVFAANALNSNNCAIAFSVGHEITWFNSSNQLVSAVAASATTVTTGQQANFSPSGFLIQDMAGATQFRVENSIVGAVNYVRVAAGATGSPTAVQCLGTDANVSLIIGAKGTGQVQFVGHTAPTADNTYQSGTSNSRWSSVWSATGAIQTSDRSLKTDISHLPPAMLGLVNTINPVTYRWKDGGKKPVTRTVSVQQPITQTVRRSIEEHQVQPDGSVHLVPSEIVSEEPVIDDIAVTLPDGTPVTDRKLRPSPPHLKTVPVYDDVPRLHGVPRTQTVSQDVTEWESVPGKRTHWGFLASDVKAAFDGVGMDFGGYVKDENGVQHLRPDQLVPVLWKAVQELAQKVAALETSRQG